MYHSRRRYVFGIKVILEFKRVFGWELLILPKENYLILCWVSFWCMLSCCGGLNKELSISAYWGAKRCWIEIGPQWIDMSRKFFVHTSPPTPRIHKTSSNMKSFSKQSNQLPPKTLVNERISLLERDIYIQLHWTYDLVGHLNWFAMLMRMDFVMCHVASVVMQHLL